MNDEELYLEYLLNHREEYLKELLKRHRCGLTYFLFGYTHNMDDAEDIMLDAFATIASGTVRFKKEYKFKTWLYTIGRNMAVSLFRKRRPETVPIDSCSEKELAVEEEYFKEEKYKVLYAALDEINPDYRQALFLTFFDGLDTDEAARVMKKSKKQMYNLCARGKKALGEILEKKGVRYEDFG